MLEGQTPADLHTGCEMGSEPLDRQSGEPDEGCYTWNLDRPQAKTMLVEMPLDAIDHRVTLNVTERAPEEFHNSRIGIHCGKRFPIGVTPLTQADAIAGQSRKGAHRYRSLWQKAGNGDFRSSGSNKLAVMAAGQGPPTDRRPCGASPHCGRLPRNGANRGAHPVYLLHFYPARHALRRLAPGILTQHRPHACEQCVGDDGVVHDDSRPPMREASTCRAD